MRVILKTWENLVNEGQLFINEDYYDTEEIFFEVENIYINEEYKNILGKEVDLIALEDIFFTREDGGYTIFELLIDKVISYSIEDTFSNFFSKDPYMVLFISGNSSQKEIKESFKKLAKKHHPDTSKLNKEDSTIIFQNINRAYSQLKD